LTRRNKSPLASILLWSVISAAFIGPGTVTTAAKAGANYDTQLLWALVFSTLACVILQEAAARIPLASGLNLGEAIAEKFGRGKNRWIKIGVAGSVIFGCAAYQAGNILGAVSGVELLLNLDARLITLTIGIICGIILWMGNIRIIANLLGIVVATMGIAFAVVALRTPIPIGEVLKHAMIPQVPTGAGWLVIGLIGTTIVPYNLFLGSGISQDQDLRTMRIGLYTAILLGGVISIAVLLVGTGIEGEFSFQNLSKAMTDAIGAWASVLFAVGLFAAGFTSSVTAPLASAITAKSVFGRQGKTWDNHSRNFRLVWGGVLMIGLIVGISGIKPIPAIILAQALNGLLLPLVAAFLLYIVNDPSLMPPAYINSTTRNILMLLVVGVSLLLGMTNLLKAAYSVFSVSFPENPGIQLGLILTSVLLTALLGWQVRKLRRA
jgi:manganese transport protein